MNTSIPVTVGLITKITSLPKAGEDPVQYIRGRDMDKKIVKQLKERFSFNGMVMLIALIVLTPRRCTLEQEFWLARLFTAINQSHAIQVLLPVPRNVLRGYK